MSDDKSTVRKGLDRFFLILSNIALWLVVVGIIILVIRRSFFPAEQGEPAVWKFLSDEMGFALLIAGVLIVVVEVRSRREIVQILTDYTETATVILRNGISQTDNAIKRGMSDITTTEQQGINRMESAVREGISRINSIEKLARIPLDLGNGSAPDILKKMGALLFSRYIDGMRIMGHGAGFEIEAKDWTMESNRIFYRLLSDLNIKDAQIFITHTGSIETWDDTEAVRATLTEQAKLIRGDSDCNNRIVRIFVGLESKPLAAESSYGRTMSLMREYGIETGYVCRQDPRRYPDMTWIPTLHLVMLWEEGAGGNVSSITFQSDAAQKRDFETTWETLIRDAEVQ